MNLAELGDFQFLLLFLLFFKLNSLLVSQKLRVFDPEGTNHPLKEDVVDKEVTTLVVEASYNLDRFVWKHNFALVFFLMVYKIHEGLVMVVVSPRDCCGWRICEMLGIPLLEY